MLLKPLRSIFEGFFRFNGDLDAAIARGIAYAPFTDMIWCETAEPNLQEARRFAEAIQERYSAVRHPRFVGTGYFDEISQIVSSGASSLVALAGSTEEEQFV